MKSKIILSAVIAMTTVGANAQLNSNENTSIGLQFGTIEYNGEYAKEIYSFDTGIHPSLGLNVARYINPSFNIRGNFRVGQIDRDVFKAKMFDINVLLDYKFNNGYILKENSFFAPYIFIGAGDVVSSYTDMNTGIKEEPIAYFNIPMGAGFMFNLSPKMSLTLETHYNYAITDQLDGKISNDTKWDDSFLYNSIGFNYNFAVGKDTDGDGVKDKDDMCPNTAKDVKVDVKGCALDSDEDGVADHLDTCPEVKGLTQYNGCPDSDGDGVQDSEDACPLIAGVSSAKGCPDADGDGIQDSEDVCPKVEGIEKFKGCPDTDGDGVEDSKDACPKVKGLVALNGCPDSDGDGVIDSKDKCPDLAGVAANNGCPEIKQETKDVFERALKGVQFESGRDVIKTSSYGILNNVADIMKENPTYKLVINGHTDSSGDDAKNMTLSKKRATAVMNYLISKGVSASRLTAFGFGETIPKATNDTPAGRATNRRVEFEVKF